MNGFVGGTRPFGIVLIVIILVVTLAGCFGGGGSVTQPSPTGRAKVSMNFELKDFPSVNKVNVQFKPSAFQRGIQTRIISSDLNLSADRTVAFGQVGGFTKGTWDGLVSVTDSTGKTRQNVFTVQIDDEDTGATVMGQLSPNPTNSNGLLIVTWTYDPKLAPPSSIRAQQALSGGGTPGTEYRIVPVIVVDGALPDGIQGYKVYRSDMPDGHYKLIATTQPSGTRPYEQQEAADSTAQEGHTYYYKLSAYTIDYRESALSSTTLSVQILPCAPAGEPQGIIFETRPRFIWAFEHDFPEQIVVLQKLRPGGYYTDWEVKDGVESGSYPFDLDLEAGKYRYFVQGRDETNPHSVIYGLAHMAEFSVETRP